MKKHKTWSLFSKRCTWDVKAYVSEMWIHILTKLTRDITSNQQYQWLLCLQTVVPLFQFIFFFSKEKLLGLHLTFKIIFYNYCIFWVAVSLVQLYFFQILLLSEKRWLHANTLYRKFCTVLELFSHLLI